MSLTIKEKLAGCLYGYAVGDAMGLGTEFMSRDEARFRYPDGLRRYSDIYRDFHRSQFKPGEWSLDTELVLILLENIIRNGSPDNVGYARELQKTYADFVIDLESHLRWIVEDKEYTSHPYEVCKRTWQAMSRHDAPNEALGRALAVALLPGNPDRHVRENVSLTHFDPRCMSSAMIIGRVANSLLYADAEPEFDELMTICHEVDERTAEYLEKAHEGDLDWFDLDDEDTYWYAHKTMGAALWALWHAGTPEKALATIMAEGGDADTNASLALGLMGLKHGVSAIPAEAVDKLLGKERIDAVVEALDHLLTC